MSQSSCNLVTNSRLIHIVTILISVDSYSVSLYISPSKTITNGIYPLAVEQALNEVLLLTFLDCEAMRIQCLSGSRCLLCRNCDICIRILITVNFVYTVSVKCNYTIAAHLENGSAPAVHICCSLVVLLEMDISLGTIKKTLIGSERHRSGTRITGSEHSIDNLPLVRPFRHIYLVGDIIIPCKRRMNHHILHGA